MTMILQVNVPSTIVVGADSIVFCVATSDRWLWIFRRSIILRNRHPISLDVESIRTMIRLLPRRRPIHGYFSTI